MTKSLSGKKTIGKTKTFSDKQAVGKHEDAEICQIIKLLTSLQNENPSDQMELSEGTSEHMNHDDSKRLFYKILHQRLLNKITR